MRAVSLMDRNPPMDTSGEILQEFFGGGGQFQEVRRKAMRRRPALAKQSQNLQASSNKRSSALKDSNAQSSPQRNSAKKVVSFSSPSFMPQSVSQSSPNENRKMAEVRGCGDCKKNVKELHLDDRNVVSDLIHRVTNISGLEPGERRIVKTPSNILDKAAVMNDLQFKDFMDPSESIKELMSRVVQTHKDIEDMAKNVFYFRQSLGRELKDLNNAFINNLQLLIGDILTLHRNKFKSQTETVNALLRRVDELERLLADCSERCDVYRHKTEHLESENAHLAGLCSNKDITIKILREEVRTLERNYSEMMDMIERQRRELEEENMKRRQEEKNMLNEERKLLFSQRQELQAEVMRQNALLQESNMMKSGHNRKDKPKSGADFKSVRQKADLGTQTEYDDFGAWDRQLGWTLPISGTAKARNRWRRSLKYASCPSCHGVGRFISAAAAQYKLFLRGEVVSNDCHDDKKWRVPDQIIRFMSNLPRGIQAAKLHDTKWVMRHVWNFFEFKVHTDAEDISLGQPLQAFSDFIIDTFLQRCERREDAEVYLFIFLKSLEEALARRKITLLHTFARFLGVFGVSEEEEQSEVYTSLGKSLTLHNEPDKSSQKKSTSRASNSNLPRGVLDVYLFSRCCMLKPYRGAYAVGIKQVKETASSLLQNQKKLEGPNDPSDSQWNIKVPDHICVSDNLSSWLPLDRALEVSTAVLGFLTEKQMLPLYRLIEHDAKYLTKNGELESPDGSHTVIRAAVRRFMKEYTRGSGDDVDAQSNVIIVVNLDKVLQATIQLLSSRIVYVESRLKKMFVDGDDNGDGELSFREFKAILGNVAPHFSNRTQLKMFREALMSGNDTSAITEKSFVSVCRKYGLVQLVDIRKLQNTVLRKLFGADYSQQPSQLKSTSFHLSDENEVKRPLSGEQQNLRTSQNKSNHSNERVSSRPQHDIEIDKVKYAISNSVDTFDDSADDSDESV